ncbi:MAG: ABC transporter permease [Ancalomicrobiaceae bacterium]|nr:ABC transporter permease [Ancalomicrobiaceae bacterium]
MTTESTTDSVQSRGKGLNLLLGLTLVGLMVVLWIALTFATDAFMSERNISNLARQGSMIAVLAIGETFVILTAGIDLSVGAVAGFASVTIAILINADVAVVNGLLTSLGLATDGNLAAILLTVYDVLAILITLGVGLCVGLFHAFGIVKMGLPPFIMTLATMQILRGAGFLWTQSTSIQILGGDGAGFNAFAAANFLGIPSLFWVVIIVGIPSYILLHQTRWGRYIFAVGSNPEAARLSGVNTQGIIYLIYALCSICAALVGIMLATRLHIGDASQAQGWELQAIASTVIGGTSLFGAVGSAYGPILGAFILATIANGANLLHMNAFWQYIITGMLIILIVYFDGLKRAKR